MICGKNTNVLLKHFFYVSLLYVATFTIEEWQANRFFPSSVVKYNFKKNSNIWRMDVHCDTKKKCIIYGKHIQLFC